MVRTPYIGYYRNPTDNLPCKSPRSSYDSGDPILPAACVLLQSANHLSQYLDHVGNIVLWSNVETAIGLIAGSIPSLRLLIVRNIQPSKYGNSSGPNSGQKSRDRGLVTIGGSAPMSNNGTRKGRSFKNPTDTGVSVTNVYAHGEGDWERLSDSSSQRQLKDTMIEERNIGGIRADYTFEVELSDRPISKRH